MMRDEWTFKKYKKEVSIIRKSFELHQGYINELKAMVANAESARRLEVKQAKETSDFMLLELSKLKNKIELFEMLQRNQKLTVKLEGPLGIVHRPYKADKEKLNGKKPLLDRAGIKGH